jgi:hypothetical protein
MPPKCCRSSCWFALLVVVAAGCGKTPVFNDLVEGAAKLDGKPLGNAHILFVPDEPDLKVPGSMGITDENGHFQLTREDGEPGALVGKNLVVVVRGRESNRSLGEKADAAEGGPGTKAKKDRRPIPPAYTAASKTKLIVNVTPDQHTYDLELFSGR